MLAAIKKVFCLAYYTSQMRFNYYFRGGEPDAYWLGSGAEFLGLYGKVLKAVLLYIFKGFRPPPDGGDDGGAALSPLVQNAGSENRTDALDLVLSDPKSASGFWALSEPDIRKQYDEVELAAVQETIAYMEQFHGWSRKGHNGEEYIRAALTFAAFPHSTSRELEPQKHHHLLLMNIAVCGDGKTRAVYAKPLYDNIHVIGAVYRNALARGLRNKLGLRLELDREQFFRLKDFSVDLADYWSTRRHQVVAEQVRVGEMSGKAAGVAATRTAKLKGTLPPLVKLHEGWREEALEMFGYTPEKLRNMMGRAKPPAYKKRVRDKALKAALRQTLQAHKNFFKEFDFHRWAIAYLCVEGYEIDDLLAHCDEFLSNHEDLVELTNNFGQRFFSTYEILEEEKVLLDTADLIRHSTSFAGVTRELQERVIAEQGAVYALVGKQLDEEQLQAIRTITSNKGDFEILTGVAGAGKTMVLETVTKIFLEAGYKVVGMGPTNRAANELQDATELETHTLASGLGDWKMPLGWKLYHHVDMLRRTAQVYRQKRGIFFKGGQIRRRKTWKLKKPRPLKIDDRTVVIADELSMLGTRQFLKLLKYAKKNGAKLVGTGDYDQIQSQERGGPLRSFCKRYKVNELTTAKRQRHVWGRKMVEEFKAGHVSKALTILRHCGEVYGAETVEQLIKQAVVSWSRWGIENPNDVAILCFENDQVFEANQQCQAMRYEHGKLKGPPLEVQYTPQGKKYTEHVFVGDKITFQRKFKPKGYVKNDSGTVLAIKGRVATIEVHGKVDGKGNPLIVDVEVRSNRPSAISLGYAGTNFKAQSASIENVVAMLAGVMLNRQQAYTALSRFREHLILLTLEHELEHFWTNAEDSPLCTAMAKSRLKGLAHDLLPKPEPLPKPDFATIDVWGEYLNSKRSVTQFSERSSEEQEMLRQANKENGFLFPVAVDAQEDTPPAAYDDPDYQEPDYDDLAAHWEESDATAYIQEMEDDEYFSETPTEFDPETAEAEYEQELKEERERIVELSEEIREDELAAKEARIENLETGELTPAKQDNIALTQIFATIENRIINDIKRENAEQEKVALATQPVAIRTSRGSAPIPTSNVKQIDPVAEKSYFEELYSRPGAERAIEELSRVNEPLERKLVAPDKWREQYADNENRLQTMADDLEKLEKDIAADKSRIQINKTKVAEDIEERQAAMVELAAKLRGDSLKSKEEERERIKKQLEDARIRQEQEKLVRQEAERPGYLKRQEREKARLETVKRWDEEAERELDTLKSLEMYSLIRKQATTRLRESHAALSVDEELDLKQLIKELRLRLEEADKDTIKGKPEDSFAVRNFYAGLHDRAEEFGLIAIYKFRKRQKQRARKKADAAAAQRHRPVPQQAAVKPDASREDEQHPTSSAFLSDKSNNDSYDDSYDREQERSRKADADQEAAGRRQREQREQQDKADADRRAYNESMERSARDFAASQKAIADSNARAAEIARQQTEAAAAAVRAAATGQSGTHSGGHSVQQRYQTYTAYTTS